MVAILSAVPPSHRGRRAASPVNLPVLLRNSQHEQRRVVSHVSSRSRSSDRGKGTSRR